MRSAALGVSVATALLLAALFAGDAVWTGVAAVLAAGAWAGLALLGRAPLPRDGRLVLAALLAVAAWSGLSIAWSIAPDRSWDELNRVLVFAAFLVVGLLFGALRPRAARPAALVLVAALGAAVLWSLAGKAIPALHEDGGRAARLRDPIGYWNALALAADMLLVLALAVAASARSAAERVAGSVLAYAAVVAVLLAASRAGVAAAVLGVALWLWLRRDRVESALLALVAAVPAVGVAAWAFTRPALVDDGGARSDRVADGAWFGLLLVAGAVVVALGSRELGRRPLRPAVRRRLSAALRGAAALSGIAVAVVLVANAGRVADEFRGEEVRNDPARFASLSSNNRLAWWGEARDVFEARPLAGAGANTFEVARKRYRDSASAVTQPHSVPLQFLAGGGIVGLALFASLVAAAAAAVVAGIRRLEGPERDAGLVLGVAASLWLVHALVDYDWDFVAVTAPALFAVGALGGVGEERVFRRNALAAAAAAALALAAAASLLTPWLAERSVRDVGRALDRGDVAAADDAAARARDLDPLSLAPLFARARVEEQRRAFAAALAAYREATRLQPENPETWLALGLFEFDRGDRCAAYTHLNEAYTLDPAGKQWTPDSELVQSLAWVNSGNCG